MSAVLGIDAAWTAGQPSGVALAVETSAGWRLLAAEPSYQRFLARSDASLPPEVRPSGGLPDARALLRAASALCGEALSIVAVDMPLSLSLIVGRRTSDNLVSKVYGARKCGTHSPSPLRPGAISSSLAASFAQEGYSLRSEIISPPCLIEVYPHPALVELSGAAERLPYKARNGRKYWPLASLAERRERIRQQWEHIAEMLECEVSGVRNELSKLKKDETGVARKAYEDALDAVVCAWVAICALAGQAKPFGDEFSAIWIPELQRVASATERSGR